MEPVPIEIDSELDPNRRGDLPKWSYSHPLTWFGEYFLVPDETLEAETEW